MLVNTEKAAEFLGVKPYSLAVLRSRGTGAPYVQEGRSIFYDTRDLEDYKAIKSAARQCGNTYRKTYLIKITKAGAVHSVLKRKAESLAHCLSELSLYPSLEGCKFEEVSIGTPPPEMRDIFLQEIVNAKPEIVQAMKAIVLGNTPAAKQAGQRKFERIIDQTMKKAIKAVKAH